MNFKNPAITGAQKTRDQLVKITQCSVFYFYFKLAPLIGANTSH